VNKEFHLIIQRHVNFAKHLVESPETSSEEELLEARRERRSLMERLRADHLGESRPI
jgi:hypothetical protein